MSDTEWRDNSTRLYDIIFRQVPIVSITLPQKLPFSRGVGWLSMDGSTLVRYENIRSKKRVEFHISNRYLRKNIGNEEDSLWQIRLTKDWNSDSEDDPITDAEYTLEQYRFPRVVPWTQKLPMYIPDSLRKDWDSMLRNGQIEDRLLFSKKRMLLGMSLVGNFEVDDERSVSIWSNTGEVLIFEVEPFHLRLKRLVPISDRERLSFHPNTLLKLDGVQIVEVQENEKIIIDNSLDPLLPIRSLIMKAWTKYQSIQRNEFEQRYIAREKYPLKFQNCRSVGTQWDMAIDCEPEAIVAWMGENIKNGGVKKINEPILMYQDVNEDMSVKGNITLLRLKKRTKTKMHAWLELSQGRIPPVGLFKIAPNKGAQTKNDREREAFLQLSAGKSSNPRLLEIIGNPKVARAPVLSTLPILERQEKFPPDDSQSKAIRKMFYAQDIVAIQGPPGTGKTKIIVQLLQYLTEDANRKKKPLKVLVSSVQNEAVYGVVERLVATGDIAIHYVEKQQFNEKSDSEWQHKMLRYHTACLERLKCNLNSKLETEENRLRDLMDEAHRCIGRLVSFQKLNDSMRDALFESLSLFQTPVLPTSHKENLKEAILDLKSCLEQPDALGAVPTEWSKVEDWFHENETRIPVEIRSKAQMSTRKIARFGKQNRLDDSAHEYQNLSALMAPLMVETSISSALINTVIAELKRIFDHCDERCESLYNTKDGVVLELYRSVQNLSAFKTLYKKHSVAVASTTSRSGQDKDEYDVVIIDEAGRASPLELFIPMVQGRKIILIGDHRQLPPVVDDQIWRYVDDQVENKPADINLFTDFFKNLPNECTHRLSTQYRSHPDIVDLINRVYYQPHNETIYPFFVDKERVSSNFPLHWDPENSRKSSSLHRTVPIDLFERRGVVWQEVSSHKCAEENQNEVDHIEKILRDMETKLDVFRSYLHEDAALQKRYSMYAEGTQPVAIIVPYSKQREKIEDMLDSNPTFKRFVQVCTIDAVQGREYPIVIFSFVRSDGRSGFLASPNRMNVAISRAQHQIILVGNRKALTTSKIKKRAKDLSRLLDYLENLEKGHEPK